MPSVSMNTFFTIWSRTRSHFHVRLTILRAAWGLSLLMTFKFGNTSENVAMFTSIASSKAGQVPGQASRNLLLPDSRIWPANCSSAAASALKTSVISKRWANKALSMEVTSSFSAWLVSKDSLCLNGEHKSANISKTHLAMPWESNSSSFWHPTKA